MEIGKTFCGRTDGRTHLSSNQLGHRRGDDLKIAENFNRLSRVHERYRQTDGRQRRSLKSKVGSLRFICIGLYYELRRSGMPRV